MEIADFPRPPDDNGRGIHWSARVYHPTGADLDFWIQELAAMHMKWVKLLDDGDGSSLELCQRLLDAGIMPVVRLYREQPNPGRLGGRERSGLRKLISVGVRYFETNNEPDLPAEWQGGHRPANWLDIVADNFIYDAEVVLAEGGLPAVPAMGPGAKENLITKVLERGREDLFRSGAWLAIHNYTLNHPLDYPEDPVNQEGRPLTREEYEQLPPWAWDNHSLEQINEFRARDKNPGATVADDPNGFRGWEYHAQLVQEALGYPIPIISTEGGPVVGWGDDRRYPKVTPDIQADWQIQITRFLQDQAPEHYFTCCTWLLASRPLGDWNPTWDQMSWYTDAWNERFGLSGRLPIVQRMKEEPPVVRPELRRGTATWTVTVVRADTGQPLPQVPVELLPLGGSPPGRRSLRGRTDDQGRLVIEGVPAGRYRAVVFDTDIQEIELAPDQQEETVLRVHNGRMARLYGQVTDPQGLPQPDLAVVLRHSPSSRLVGTTRTDPTGRYQFDGLPAMKATLRVAPGTDQATQVQGIRLDGWSSLPLDVTVPPAAARRYRVVRKRLLSPQETGNDNLIFGQVLDEQGEPLDGVTVRLRWEGAAPGTAFPTVRSGQSPFKPRGYFEFIHTPGVFMVDVVDPEVDSEVAEGLVTADTPERRRPIAYEVVFQRSVAARPVALSRIQGRVLGGPPQAVVMLTGGDGPPQATRLQSDGSFGFQSLPAGEYQLLLEGIGVIAEEILLDGANTVLVEFPMVGRIRGQVLPPSPTATVVLTSERYSIRQQDTTDPEGTYEFQGLPADVYTLRVADSDLPPQSVACDGIRLVSGPVFHRSPQAGPEPGRPEYLLWILEPDPASRQALARAALEFVLRTRATVRFQPGGIPQVPQVVLVGAPDPDLRQRLQEAGIQVHAVPPDPEALETSLARLP